MAPPTFDPIPPTGTLIIQCDDETVHFSLEGIEADVWNTFVSATHISLSARVAGKNFVDLDPGVRTVADLSLGMLHKTRIRVTTNKGVHEGVLHSIATEVEVEVTDLGARKPHGTYIGLGVGNAFVPVKTTDLAEVIREDA